MHVACEHAAESFSESVGGYQMPDSKAVPDVDDFLGSFGDMFRTMGDSLTGLADSFASDTPVDQAVAEYIREVAAGLTNMGEGGDEVHQTWREANAADIERHESPRPAEEAFNV
jgi:hypothetical protein